MASAPYIKSAGTNLVTVSPGRMNDTVSINKVIRTMIASRYCYICREELDLTNMSELDNLGQEIRKVGKKYKRTTYHLSCDKSLVS